MNTLVDALSVGKGTSAPFRPLNPISTVELLRITHQHTPSAGKCDECGFTTSEKSPLCPSAADALRELASRDIHRPSSTRELSDLTTMELMQRAAAHHPNPSGRCERCGFVYAENVQDCPQLRVIRRLLEARGMIPLAQPEPGKAMCAGKPQSWELQGQNLAAWQRAKAACNECPLLKQCEESLRQGRILPQDQIVAGKAFDYYGDLVSDQRLRAYAINRGRKPRVYKTSGAQLRTAEDAA